MTTMRVPVTTSEYQKFCYLIKTIDAIDRAHELVKQLANELKSQDGVQAQMKFDWLNVVRHCTPQLQVVLLRDSHDRESERLFVEYPVAVVVVSTAQVVDLSGDFELSLVESSSDNGATDAANAIQTLRTLARAEKGSRAMDAEKILHQLERVLRVNS